LGRRHLNDLVLDVKNTRQVAMLFVTHSVEEAVYMADTVLVLSHRPGQIVARIDVAAPQGTARHDGFLLSPEFGRKVVEVRKALAAGVVEAAA
jgi:NitT/TauT family transport system ATP-binding protein